MRRSFALVLLLLGAPSHAVVAQTVIQAKEELRIDAESHDLLPIWWLWVSPKGVMVASQPQDWAFRFFAPDGTALGSFGRKGEGPAEFRNVQGTRAGWIGDTLWLTEAMQPRLTLVGPDRKLLRMERLPPALLDPRGDAISPALLTQAFVVGIAPDRSYQVMSMRLPNSPGPSWLADMAKGGLLLAIQARDGRFRQFIAGTPDDIAACERRQGGVSISVPFCPRPAMTEPLDRDRVVVAIPGTATASGGSFRLLALNASTGDTTLNREVRYRPVPIPTRVSDSIRTARNSNTRLPPAVRAAQSRTTFPPFYPPFRHLLTGRDGTIALSVYGAVAGKQRWRFLDPTGMDIGMVDFPATVRLFAIERGRAWGTDGEPGDQDSIVRYSWPAGR